MRGGAEGALLAGRYRIVRQLGTGGMGSVWLAEDSQLDNKLFAVKMLPSVLVSNKRAYRQLKDEAIVAMKLVHPNIVQIRAFEENNGNPFLVMDYIDGQTLDDYLAEKGTLSEEEAVKLLKPIAAALDYAHGQGVIHRDVKPANVMIRNDGQTFILDFGIARGIQETMTRVTGKLSSGTLLYMSPEQLNGEAPKKEQDIYSFAATVYECLKGEPPFVRGAIEDQIKNKKPELLGANIKISLSVMHGLAKKPEERPKTCKAVLEEHEEILHTPNTPSSHSSDASRQSSCLGKMLIIFFFLAVLIGGVILVVVLPPSTKPFPNETKPSPYESFARAFPPGKVTGDTMTINLPGGEKMEMIYVAPGSFMMGDNKGWDEAKPVHRVKLTRGFWMGKYEVTQEQWRSVMNYDPNPYKGNRSPVEGVSWDDCQMFIQRVNASLNCGVRLPTEAEWEYACRAGTTGDYAGTGKLDDMGWYSGTIMAIGRLLLDSQNGAHPVGQKKANAWGFYDMHGNVFEWCNDWYGNYPYGGVTDPVGPSSSSGEGRVMRGGSWKSVADGCTSSWRCGGGWLKCEASGFRLCCPAAPYLKQQAYF